MTGKASRSPWPGTVAAGGALVLGAWLLAGGGTSGPPAPDGTQGMDHAATAGLLVPPRAHAVPTRIRIPALRVDAPVSALGLDGGGRLEPPAEHDRNLAGWYRDGVTPGQRGTAIMAGHVDLADGPAVFYGLGTLRKGDQVEVDGADRGTGYFTVDGVESFAKKDFPDARVYGRAADSQLRLITCGGGFTAAHGWDANVVVFAHLVRSVS
ncbi:class F sortase [Kitasatospora sp. NPDC002040]|uniref:class F sortase n=1 Tax=Kitasatospora sp. NPDC002040 TaxID=3154661 RepID=UPI003316CE80